MNPRIEEERIAFIFKGITGFNPIVGISTKWYNWITDLDEKTCVICQEEHGRIRASIASWSIQPPVHPHCRCIIDFMETVEAGTATIDGLNGTDYRLMMDGRLPDGYLTKKEAKRLGWVKKSGNLHIVAPGKRIGGDIFDNDKSPLPNAPGRTWYEADINYIEGFRNRHRVLYSSDGLLFITFDHYESFFELI